jgi:hypothetical protein
MTSDEFREMWLRHWAHVGIDENVVHEDYHDDAVLEFPQSGERFEGRATFQEWREKYPAKVGLELVRVSGSGDHWVAEGRIQYDDGPPAHTVTLVEVRDGKVAHERIYVSEGWDAPEWRRPYRASRPAEGSQAVRDG